MGVSMARFSYNPSNSTVSINDVAALTIGQTTLVTSNASTLHIRTTVSGLINGTLDVVYTGQFEVLGGVPIGGQFTGLRVDLDNQTLLEVTGFSLPLSATQEPDLNGVLYKILEGDDVVDGALLNDILEGFAGADTISGGGGNDFVQGNMGADTLDGGEGDDVVRGGRDDDVLFGGAGDDFISGDRGNDTVSGGAGADTFHVFEGAGLDRVTDFNRAEGDRVALLTGETYTVTQDGADVVIDLGSGDRMVLVGVQQSSLTGDWLVFFG